MIHRFTPISSSWTLTFRATDYCHRWYQSLLGSVPGFFMYQTPMVLKRGSFSTCLHSSCPPIPQIVHIPRHPDFVQRVYTYNSSFQRSDRLTLRWKIISPPRIPESLVYQTWYIWNIISHYPTMLLKSQFSWCFLNPVVAEYKNRAECPRWVVSWSTWMPPEWPKRPRWGRGVRVNKTQSQQSLQAQTDIWATHGKWVVYGE